MSTKNNSLYKKFSEAFHEVVVPELQEIKDKLTNVERGVDSLSRKFDAQQERLDRHDKRIQTLERVSL